MNPASRKQRTHSGPRRRTALSSLIGIAIALMVAAGAAFGYWVGTDNSNPAQAAAATLSAPTTPTAHSTSSTSITIGWSLPTQQIAGATYKVSRTSGPGSPLTVCTVSTTSCSDSSLVPGDTYDYSIVAVLSGTNWQSSAITTSATTSQETPNISTQTSLTSVIVGNSLTDSATVANGYSPTGTITWHVYASTDTACANPLFNDFTSTVDVSGDSSYSSGSLTPTAPGTYIWGITYSGDTSNAGVSQCGGVNESFTVTKATPTISTTASAAVTIGQSVTDAATLSNGYNETGTLTWHLYGQSDTTCTTALFGYTGTQTVNGNGMYSPTNAATPTAAGTYKWGVSFSDTDGNNNGVSLVCGGSNESVAIGKATPSITTTTSIPASFVVGGSTSDTANLSGGYSPTGTLTWHVYAQTDTTCTTPLFSFTGAQTVNGNGDYSPTTSVTPTSVGNYKWGVSFSDTDGNNNNVSLVCGGSNESFTVTATSPTLAVAASSNVTAGTPITPSATLGNAYNPAGTITFYVSGPGSNPTSCPGTMTMVGTTTVSGIGTYNANASYTPSVVGTYWWYASYGGDGNNGTAASLCNSASMTKTTVAKATPTLTATGPSTGTTNTAIPVSSIGSVLAGSSGTNATWTITFEVFGPQSTAPTSCGSGATTWTGNTATVSGGGTYHPTGTFTPSAAGDYWWYATYNGDSNNAAATSTCGSGMSETVVSTPLALSLVNGASNTDTSGNNSSITTGSFSVPANTLALIVVAYGNNSNNTQCGSASTSATSPFSTTPASISNLANWSTNNDHLSVCAYSAKGSGSTGTATIGFNAKVDSMAIQVYDLNDTAATIVAGSSGTAQGTGTSPAVSLGVAATTGDDEVFVGDATNGTTTVPTWSGTLPSGFTQSGLQSITTGSGKHYWNSAVYFGPASTTVTATNALNSTSDAWGVIGIEIQP